MKYVVYKRREWPDIIIVPKKKERRLMEMLHGEELHDRRQWKRRVVSGTFISAHEAGVDIDWSRQGNFNENE